MRNKLENNIIKYAFFRIFTKRVYLPLIAIFLTTVGNVTLAQFGIIASITAIICIILEIPTGYISDKWGHKSALVFGAIICAISVLPYLFMPNFYGGLLASVLFFTGASFTSGTMQAFMHETLLSLGRENEYVKVMGKVQSYGLLGNVVLISVIPLTYKIDPRLPFIIGFFCLLICALIAMTLVKPNVKIAVKEKFSHSFKNLLQTFPKNSLIKLFLVFIIFGVSSSAFDSSNIYRELIFKDIGIPIEYFGFILAIGSLFAAITGRYIHHLKKLSPSGFYLFDILYICLAYLLVGLTNNPILIVIAFILFPTYDRTRSIIFESQLFEEFNESKYKATMVSILNFFPLVFNVGMPLLLASLVAKINLLGGYWLFGIILVIIFIPLLYSHNFINNKLAYKEQKIT